MANLTRDQVERIYADSRNSKLVAKDFGVSVSAVQKIWAGYMYGNITKDLKRPDRYNPNKKKAIKLPFSDVDFLSFCKPWNIAN